MTLKVLIADDELLARKRLTRLLGAMSGVAIVGEVADGAAVLQALSPEVDVVLLDIQMPGLTGVEAMKLWPDDGPHIVFTTAHAEHAVEAFAGGAADYLLKPVEAGRLKQALDRVRARQEPPELPADRLPLSTPSGVLLLDPAEIRCALIEGESVVMYTDRGRHFTDQRLSELEDRLVGAGSFYRVHRRALVNLRRVLRLESLDSGGYIAHTDGGEAAPVSRKVARELRRRWGL
ncbi:MAG: LytTR family DNA-binding domain-containing protein [Myxococcota bacterium]